MTLTIHNAKIVTPNGVIENGLLKIENGIIVDISLFDGTVPHGSIDASGRWVLPGLIDMHSDAIETEILPRANGGLFPIDIAFAELEKKLANHGITTIYHALGIAENVMKKPLRNPDMMRRIMETMRTVTSERQLIRHRIHLRCEVTRLDLIDFVEELLTTEVVHLLSFTDHTPGQGQYRDMEVYKNIWKKRMNATEEEVERMAQEKQQTPRFSMEQLRRITELASRNRIAIASHDDDSVEKLEVMQQLHAVISEFPVALDVAQEAKRRGMYVAMGAPNILLGRSHSNNLSAREAHREGVLDILCSDYYPSSLLHAVFQLHQLGYDLSAATNLVTLNPARALGIDHLTGSLEEGKAADLIIVDQYQERPYVQMVMVGGRIVSQMDYSTV